MITSFDDAVKLGMTNENFRAFVLYLLESLDNHYSGDSHNSIIASQALSNFGHNLSEKIKHIDPDLFLKLRESEITHERDRAVAAIRSGQPD